MVVQKWLCRSEARKNGLTDASDNADLGWGKVDPGWGKADPGWGKSRELPNTKANRNRY